MTILSYFFIDAKFALFSSTFKMSVDLIPFRILSIIYSGNVLFKVINMESIQNGSSIDLFNIVRGSNEKSVSWRVSEPVTSGKIDERSQYMYKGFEGLTMAMFSFSYSIHEIGDTSIPGFYFPPCESSGLTI